MAERYIQAFSFALQDRVRLREIDRPGRITGIAVNTDGIEYRVIYWEGGSRKMEWVYDWEIELIKE